MDGGEAEAAPEDVRLSVSLNLHALFIVAPKESTPDELFFCMLFFS